jgi:plastocyanin
MIRAGVICLALAAGGTVAAGCGGEEGSSTASISGIGPGAASAPAAESTDRVEIADFEYAPEAITVSVGTKVTWTNSDQAAHTATADDGSFDTATIDKGDSAAATFDTAGSYAYYCRFHPFMKATVEVQ